MGTIAGSGGHDAPRTIVVTGSASGIGAATAARLRSAGHRVIGVDLRDAEVVADLSRPDGRAGAIRDVTALAGATLDGFVACAGVSGLTSELVVSINFFGAAVLLVGLQPLLSAAGSAAGGAAAVMIASNSISMVPSEAIPTDLVNACLAGDEAGALAAASAINTHLAYPASKLAIAQLVRRLAVTPDWAGAGIRLNAVAPGVIRTPMTDRTAADPVTGPAMASIPIPAGGMGDPTDIAAVIEFLLSPAARFVIGAVWFADGGTDPVLHPTRVP